MELEKKRLILQKIHKSSIVMGIGCLSGVLLQAVILLSQMQLAFNKMANLTARMSSQRMVMSAIFSIVILLMAALVFFRMSRSDKPFTGNKTKVVLLVAVLMLVKAVVIAGMTAAATASWMAGAATLISQTSLLEGMLFLFLTLILHYAEMLQQESDETL